jgi:alpha-1,6-mannosyltransferase
MVQSVPSAAGLPGDETTISRAGRTTGLSKRTAVQGVIGSLFIMIGSLGAGGTLISDPILGNSPFAWIRWGHGQQLAQFVLYVGVGLLVWAWVRLGRDVLAKRVTPRGVLLAGLAWMVPMIFSPPAFTRDVYSYLGQGEQLLKGINPYGSGPSVLGDTIALNVHPFWESTPAPYGPLFLLLAKGVAAVIGEHVILGVILMRLVLMVGLLVLVLSLPGLVGHLGGRLSVAFWLMVASPMTVIHLVGGPHNDLLMIGLLAAGVLLVLNKHHVSGIALVTLAMAVKATAGVALPFLMWVWAGRLEGTLARRFVRATAAVVGIVIVVFGVSMLVAGVDFGWIPALHAPTLIVNWTNLPTGFGEIAHVIVRLFGNAPEQPFVNMFRVLGIALLLGIMITQWWKARDGGTEAVRRMGFALLAVAILAPPTLPWYLTWGLTILSATPWRRRWLAFSAALAVLILLVYYPNGEGAMGSLPHMIWVILAALLTGAAMLKYDPLGLRAKPDDHGTLPGDVSAAVPHETPVTDVTESATAEVVDAPDSVDEPLPSRPASA